MGYTMASRVPFPLEPYDVIRLEQLISLEGAFENSACYLISNVIVVALFFDWLRCNTTAEDLTDRLRCGGCRRWYGRFVGSVSPSGGGDESAHSRTALSSGGVCNIL